MASMSLGALADSALSESIAPLSWTLILAGSVGSRLLERVVVVLGHLGELAEAVACLCGCGLTAATAAARGDRDAQTNGQQCKSLHCESPYSPRTRLTMSLAMFGGTSMYWANCIVYVARPWVRDRRSVE